MRRFFDHVPTTWQELEELVAQSFTEMGYESSKNFSLKTARGTVAIDVFAVKRSTPIPTTVLCECKYWDKAVPQNVVHGFRTVCADAGAHFGLIISKVGFQRGANETREFTNVHLMNFEEFQETFFDEWKTGAFVLLAKMESQILPILRASHGYSENGLDLISESEIEGIDPFQKYSILLGNQGRFSNYFVNDGTFPDIINDPRGDPRKVSQVEVHSHREYLEIAREAVIEATQLFNLPRTYFADNGGLKTLGA